MLKNGIFIIVLGLFMAAPCWAGKRKASDNAQEMKRRKIQEKLQSEEQLPDNLDDYDKWTCPDDFSDDRSEGKKADQLPEKDFFKVNPAWYEWLKLEKEQAYCKLFEA